MPTAVRLTGLECRLDTDQDPEAFVCSWYGYEVPTGDTFVLSGNTETGDPVSSGLEDAMVGPDYEFE